MVNKIREFLTRDIHKIIMLISITIVGVCKLPSSRWSVEKSIGISPYLSIIIIGILITNGDIQNKWKYFFGSLTGFPYSDYVFAVFWYAAFSFILRDSWNICKYIEKTIKNETYVHSTTTNRFFCSVVRSHDHCCELHNWQETLGENLETISMEEEKKMRKWREALFPRDQRAQQATRTLRERFRTDFFRTVIVVILDFLFFFFFPPDCTD